jgi:enediyne biosynthesis protein E4
MNQIYDQRFFSKALSTLILAVSICQVSLAQTFTKITTGPVVSTPGDSRSVNWVDINNDGWLDLMISNGPSAGQVNFVYLNDGTGAFTAVSGDPIVSDAKPFDGASWADTDNDGDMDCFVVTWYGVTNYFYTNNGSGAFTKVITGSLVTQGTYSETCSWGDFDKDGLVDLYICNSDGTLRNNLFRNTGNNTFTQITSGDVVTDTFASRCVNWTDIDNDGDADLFVTNEYNQNENIYRNDGSGAFTRLTSGGLLNNGGNTMSGSWADYDNDGDMDVFLANDQGDNALFRNDGGFNFTKMMSDTVSNSNGRSFSSAWSDIDNDGDQDLFVTNSFQTGTLLLNFMYINNGDGTFSRVNNTAPATDLDWSYGCAFGDYDNDGFEDLAVATCRFAGINREDLLYHNDGNSNHWITIKLIGTASNKAAIGAKIKVKATINGTSVWQMREITAQSSYCGQNDMRAHFGLGDADSIEAIDISWPSGLHETFPAEAADQFLTITETPAPNGISEIKPADGFSVYPNPSNSTLTISMPDASLEKGDKIRITDGRGSLVKEYSVDAGTNKFTVDLKNLALPNAAHYFITIISRHGIMTKKVIKR